LLGDGQLDFGTAGSSLPLVKQTVEAVYNLTETVNWFSSAQDKFTCSSWRTTFAENSTMRFIAAHPEILSPEVVEQCYMAGIEGVPWQTTNTLVESELVIESGTQESGNLFIAWPTKNQGKLMLVTGSLVPREAAYALEVELARGTVHRLRQYIALGRLESISIPSRVSNLLEEATLLCGQAVTGQDDPLHAADLALESIGRSLEAIEDLACWDGGELFRMRLKQQDAFNILLGFTSSGRLAPEAMPDKLAMACNMSRVPLCWKTLCPDDETFSPNLPRAQFDWCERHDMKVMAGPVISFQQENFPDWLDAGQVDFPTLQSECRAFTSQCVKQFKDHVHLWHASSGMNRILDMTLSEEQSVRLAIDTVEVIRRHDQQTPVIVSFQQPWGEYLSRYSRDLSPIHFADALVRADLGINGIGLEIDWQHSIGSTRPRDLVALSNELDRWTLLQMPLVIFLSAPTGLPDESESYSANQVEQLLTVMLGRPSVQVIVWDQLQDTPDEVSGRGGLLDSEGSEKPILQVFQHISDQLKTSPAPPKPEQEGED